MEVIKLNRKILLTVLALTAVLVATPFIGTVHAKQPSSISFETHALGFGEPTYRLAGNNWISDANSYGFLVGDLVGEYAGNAHWIYHNWAGPYEDPFMLTVGLVSGHGLGTYELTEVMGMEKTGTIKLMWNDVFADEFAGTWVIYGGTDELKGLHGQGTWHVEFIIVGGQIVGGFQAFEGQIHFDP